LFNQVGRENLARAEPLAVRMRPKTLDEFVGQTHFIGPGKRLRRMLDADRLASLIFYGPPGTGKTTLAWIIADASSARFEQVNAAQVGVKDIRDILDEARHQLAHENHRTVLFLDELHRFNRAQQDVLLRDVESGVIILIGATTQNPFFALNAPLISRSQIFQFEPLTQDDITALLRRALMDSDRGLGRFNVEITDEAIQHLAVLCDGDARRALTALEVGVCSQADKEKIVFDLEVAQESIQRKAVVYDGTGDEHYDTASAFIKSMRGSDPDAAVYWLAKMLEAGEDPRFIARRIVICAAEDVGNADPQALVLANAALGASEFVGMPEAQLILSQAVIYISCAPKSNASAQAIWSASRDVKENRTVPVPKPLRGTGYSGAVRLGHGTGYKYSQDFSKGFVKQVYLGVDKEYYTPSDRGYESKIRRWLDYLKNESNAS